MVKRSSWALFAAVALLAGAAGCGSSADGGTAQTGQLDVALTDAPAPYQAVNVTVEAVRVRPAAAAGDDAWHEIVLDPPRRIDLLELSNGATLDLGSLSLPAGRYDQIRLVLAENGGGAQALRNSVVLDDAQRTEIALKTPSAARSGLKVKGEFEIVAGERSEIVLDFDAHRSVVVAGNSGQRILKPVINAIVIAAAGKAEIGGHVGVPDAWVSAQVVGEDGRPRIVRATVSAADGGFSLSPLPQDAGHTFTVVIDAPGYRTHVIRNVVAAAGGNTVLPPVVLTAAAAPDRHSISGSVGVPAGFEDSLLFVGASRVLDGLPVLIAETPVQLQTHDYVFSVARELPLVAEPGAGPLVFAEPADAVAALPYVVSVRDADEALAPASTSLSPPSAAGQSVTGLDLQLSSP